MPKHDTYDFALADILRKAICAPDGTMTDNYSAWAKSALSADEFATLARYGIKPKDNVFPVTMRVAVPEGETAASSLDARTDSQNTQTASLRITHARRDEKGLSSDVEGADGG